MFKVSSPIIRLLWSSALGVSLTSPLLAAKAPVKPGPPLKPSQEREDYQECIAAVIKKYKVGELPQRKLRIQNGINSCRERYPAVSIMIDCKKEMVKAYSENHEDLKLALKQCRDEYSKYTFNPKTVIPFTLKDEQAYFAGAGLNRPLMIRARENAGSNLYLGGNFGNFSCTPLQGAMFEGQTPEHLLFGNDLFLYTPLRHANKEAFVASLGLKLGKKNEVFFNRELGEIHFTAASSELMNYFPSSYCYYDRKLGDVFEGMKIYYLLDKGASEVSPYFGIAFYQDKTQINSAELADQIKTVLGQNYEVTEEKKGVYLIAQPRVKEVDAEGDPKNICQSGQIPPYMALVHSRPGSSLAAYSLLANTANLCRFGDRMTSRLLKKGSEKKPLPSKE